MLVDYTQQAGCCVDNAFRMVILLSVCIVQLIVLDCHIADILHNIYHFHIIIQRSLLSCLIIHTFTDLIYPVIPLLQLKILQFITPLYLVFSNEYYIIYPTIFQIIIICPRHLCREHDIYRLLSINKIMSRHYPNLSSCFFIETIKEANIISIWWFSLIQPVYQHIYRDFTSIHFNIVKFRYFFIVVRENAINTLCKFFRSSIYFLIIFFSFISYTFLSAILLNLKFQFIRLTVAYNLRSSIPIHPYIS